MADGLGWTFLVLFALQNGSNAVVAQYVMHRAQPVNTRVAVLLQELIKLPLSMLLYTYESGGLLAMARRFGASTRRHPFAWCAVSVSALFFTAGAVLQFESAKRLDAAFLVVLFQSNKIFVAGLSILLLRTEISPRQWVAIVLLCAGIGLALTSDSARPFDAKHQHSDDLSPADAQRHAIEVGLHGGADGIRHHPRGSATPPAPPLRPKTIATRNVPLGIAYCLGAAVCSALASVYSELLVKRGVMQREPDSLWLYNIQLATVSALLALSGIFSHGDLHTQLFRGFDVWAMSMVISGAFACSRLPCLRVPRLPQPHGAP